MLLFIRDALLSSASTIFHLTLILIPIMILLEYFNHFHLLEKLTPFIGWLPRSLTLSPKAAFPLIIGLFVGITYGAAVIIEYTRQGSLTKRDMLLCGIFLAINHSMIEDNLLLVSLGANLFVIFPVRFIMAFVITRAVAYYLDQKSSQTIRDASPNSKIQKTDTV
jgi:hypothetical protein